MEKSGKMVNQCSNGEKKPKSRFELAKELFLDAAKGGETDFYVLLRSINAQLAKEGKKSLTDDDFVDVIESAGWAI